VNDRLQRFGRRRSWPNFKLLSPHWPGENEENHENLSHKGQSPGQLLIEELPEYETGMCVKYWTTRFGHILSNSLLTDQCALQLGSGQK
jgi:hypothetical protein